MSNKKSTKPRLSLVESFHYITLRAPFGTFTLNNYGYKAGGTLVGAADKLHEHINSGVKTGKYKNYGEAMRALTDESLMGQLAPGWDAAPSIPGVGATVRVTHPSLVSKYGEPGTVTQTKKKYTYVRFPGRTDSVGFEHSMLTEVK